MTAEARDHILTALNRLGKSQAWLADELGITKAYFSLLMLSQRRVSLALALQIHDLTGVPVRGLILRRKLKPKKRRTTTANPENHRRTA